MLKFPLGEVSVRWQEIEGSKLSPLLDAIQMFRCGQLVTLLVVESTVLKPSKWWEM